MGPFEALVAFVFFVFVVGLPILVINLLVKARRKVVPPEHAADPGWYPDPSGRYERRWWDGDQWTNDVARGSEAMRDSESADGTGAQPD